jgi:hypothetical protein
MVSSVAFWNESCASTLRTLLLCVSMSLQPLLGVQIVSEFFVGFHENIISSTDAAISRTTSAATMACAGVSLSSSPK